VKFMHESRKSPQIFAIAVSMAGSLCGQTAPAPAFDAASVKLSSPLDAAAMMSRRARRGITIDAGRIDIANTSLFGVFAGAYRLTDYQLSGSGLDEDGQGGYRWHAAQGHFAGRYSGNTSVSAGGTLSAEGMVISALPRGGTMRITFGGAGLHIERSSATTKTLADDLTQYLDRPVMDKTQLAKLSGGVGCIDGRYADFPGSGGAPPGGFGGGVGDGFGGGGNGSAPRGDSEPAGASILASLQ
jgi:hypothetical protein